MKFRILSNELPGDAVRRIIDEQIQRGIEEITNPNAELVDQVHNLRKRIKKIRAVLRVARSELGDSYTQENDWFKKTARSLSDIRDAHALIETWDRVDTFRQGYLTRRQWEAVRRHLGRKQRSALRDLSPIGHRIEQLKGELEEHRSVVKNLQMDFFDDEFPRSGIRRTYARGRKAMQEAYEVQTQASFHEWRKRVKYHWYHLRLLTDLWPGLLKGWRKVAGHLADILGDEHDLTVLQTAFEKDGSLAGSDATYVQVIQLVQNRQEILRKGALPLGKRLFAEKPKCLNARLSAYWNISKQEWQRYRKG